MTRSILVLSALTLATAVPALAGLLSSPMSGVIQYPGSANDLSADFVLYNEFGTEIFRTDADLESFGGHVEVGSSLNQSPYSHLDDTEWCLEIDATNANGQVIIDFFNQQDGQSQDLTQGNNENIAGSIGDLCAPATLVF